MATLGTSGVHQICSATSSGHALVILFRSESQRAIGVHLMSPSHEKLRCNLRVRSWVHCNSGASMSMIGRGAVSECGA